MAVGLHTEKHRMCDTPIRVLGKQMIGYHTCTLRMIGQLEYIYENNMGISFSRPERRVVVADSKVSKKTGLETSRAVLGRRLQC